MRRPLAEINGALRSAAQRHLWAFGATTCVGRSVWNWPCWLQSKQMDEWANRIFLFFVNYKSRRFNYVLFSQGNSGTLFGHVRPSAAHCQPVESRLGKPSTSPGEATQAQRCRLALSTGRTHSTHSRHRRVGNRPDGAGIDGKFFERVGWSWLNVGGCPSSVPIGMSEQSGSNLC